MWKLWKPWYSFLYHSFLSEKNLTQNTFSIILCKAKSQWTEHERKVSKRKIQTFHVYGFQLISADCQASKRHCKIVSAQAKILCLCWKRDLYLSTYVSSMRTSKFKFKGQLSESSFDPVLTIEFIVNPVLIYMVGEPSFINPSHSFERNWRLHNTMCIIISILNLGESDPLRSCLLKSVCSNLHFRSNPRSRV